MKIIKLNYFILLALSVLIITSCGKNDSLDAKKEKLESLKNKKAEIADQITALELEIAAKDTTDHNENAKIVAVTPLQASTFTNYIDVQGRVDGDENTVLAARVMSSVVRVYAKTGDKVSVGQLLAEFDADIVKKQMQDLQTSLNFASEVYNKQKSLWDNQVGSEIQFLQAKSNKESLEQKLATLRENVQMFKIVAPYTGIIDDAMIKVGQTVMPGSPCFRIVNFSKLKVKADLAETYASRVKPGNKVGIYFPDLNTQINSVVRFSGNSISLLNRTFGVEAEIPSDNSYIPNMIAILKIVDYQVENAMVVPINIVHNSGGKSYVYVAEKKDKLAITLKKEVEIGKIYNDKAEIRSGLNIGDLLITTGYQNLNDNEVIKF